MYRRTTQQANADNLSRLPTSIPHQQTGEDTEEVHVFSMKQINLLLLTAGHLKRETGRDTLLSKVFTHVQSGWPKMVEDIKLGVC